jgi:hypothetical protein
MLEKKKVTRLENYIYIYMHYLQHSQQKRCSIATITGNDFFPSLLKLWLQRRRRGCFVDRHLCIPIVGTTGTRYVHNIGHQRGKLCGVAYRFRDTTRQGIPIEIGRFYPTPIVNGFWYGSGKGIALDRKHCQIGPQSNTRWYRSIEHIG